MLRLGKAKEWHGLDLADGLWEEEESNSFRNVLDGGRGRQHLKKIPLANKGQD